jgi:hypothetical protein
MDKQITVKFSGGREGEFTQLGRSMEEHMQLAGEESVEDQVLTECSHWNSQGLRPAYEPRAGRGQGGHDR